MSSTRRIAAPAAVLPVLLVTGNASARVGVRSVRFLDFPDGYLTPDLALRKQVVRVLRQVRPDIVVTCDATNFFPSDRTSTIPTIAPPAKRRSTPSSRPPARRCSSPSCCPRKGCSLTGSGRCTSPCRRRRTQLIDVTGTLERKIAALRVHRSQIPDQAGLEARIRERLLDPASPPEAPRYVERFRLIDLGR